MTRRRTLIAAALLCAGCSSLPSEPGGVPVLLDQLPRPLTTSEQGLIGSTNDFSFSLFRTVSAAQRDANVFISPLSASYALGVAANGADGATLGQMRTALSQGGMAEGDVNGGYKGLGPLLRGLDPRVDLRIANAIWTNRDFPMSPTFAQVSGSSFDARTASMDFRDPATLAVINGWVSDATAGKIPSILESLDPGMVMVLVNAIYFKGSWRERFDPAETIDASFHGVGGDTPARLMHRTGDMSYLAAADWDAVDLPYGNGAFTMTVVLPHPGTSVETVATSMGSTDWAASMARMHETRVDLLLPRVHLEWQRRLDPDLQALGMRDALVDGRADFSRLSATGSHDPFIGFVLQKTYVDVNEEGTEAAAATAVGVGITSMPQVLTMRVDRPFIMVLRERLSGTVLFMGKVVRIP